MWKSTLKRIVNTAAFGLAVGVAGWLVFHASWRENRAAASPELENVPLTKTESHADHAPKQAAAEPLHPGAGGACCPVHPAKSEAGVIEEEAPSAAGESPNAPWCHEHDLSEAECGACNPGLTATLLPGESLKLRLPSEAAAGKAGIELGTAETGATSSATTLPCKVMYDQNHMAHITPLVSGVVAEVRADLGQRVSEGEVLIVLTSSELAELRGAHVAALAEAELASAVYEREKGLRDKGITSAQEFQEAVARQRQAQTQADSTRQRLISLGIQEEALRRGDVSKVPDVVLRAPFSGTIVERHAVRGEAVERSTPVMTLANLDTMWIEVAAPVSQAGTLQTGVAVSVRFDAFDDRSFDGKIDWVDSRVDEQNRTVRARAVVPNPDGILKDGMFGEAHLVTQHSEGGLLVPAESVHTYDENPFLFVRISDDLYEVRRVALGGRTGDRIEIREGLATREQFVATRGFTVKSEFLKARLGAGCTDD